MCLSGLVSVKPLQCSPCPQGVAVVLSEAGTPKLYSEALESSVRRDIYRWFKNSSCWIKFAFEPQYQALGAVKLETLPLQWHPSTWYIIAKLIANNWLCCVHVRNLYLVAFHSGSSKITVIVLH